jgi:hypothetical protein
VRRGQDLSPLSVHPEIQNEIFSRARHTATLSSGNEARGRARRRPRLRPAGIELNEE